MNETPIPESHPAEPEETSSTGPGFLTCLGWLFVSPGKLGEELSERPRFFYPALLGLLFTLASLMLVPADIMAEIMRAQ